MHDQHDHNSGYRPLQLFLLQASPGHHDSSSSSSSSSSGDGMQMPSKLQSA
jgi:hypothetical protein